MEKQAWVNQELTQLAETSKSFQEVSLLLAVKQVMHEQQKRIDQKQAELDGRMWNPGKW
ncbi:hypothetical protein [Paucilactobacillus sp. N302-9]